MSPERLALLCARRCTHVSPYQIFIYEMSSNSELTLIPTFGGSNWIGFSELMKAYLQAKGIWYVIEEDEPDFVVAAISLPPSHEGSVAGDAPAATTAAAPTAATISEEDRKEFREWRKDNGSAMGFIRLRVTTAIAETILKKHATARRQWHALQDQFAKVTSTEVYTQFKSALDLTIPSDGDPTPALNKLYEHFERLDSFSHGLPTALEAMLVVVKAPGYAGSVIQTVTAADPDDLVAKDVGNQVINAWRTKNLNRGNKAANKVSAVKQKKGNPNFSQQQQQPQQQRPQGQQQQGQQQQQGGRKKTRRGGKGKGKSYDGHQGHNHQATMSFVSPIVALPPRPASPPPTPRPLEDRIEGVRPVRAGQNQYPGLRKAIDLANQLGVPGTSERLRALEPIAEAIEHLPTPPLAAPEFVEGSSRPSKRKRTDPYETDSDEERLYSFSEQAKAYARGEPLPPIPSLVDENDGMVNTPMWVDDDGATLDSEDDDRVSLGSFDVDEEIADAALWQVSSFTPDQCASTDAAFSDSICIMPLLVPDNNLWECGHQVAAKKQNKRPKKRIDQSSYLKYFASANFA
ncbi:hypothetical protein BC629DRAFT_1440717 [Irpex lacteus]|nr:hypothetical protein BC629DRAFT_1440717 [Irpex lacteus]